ncbi:Family S33 non-peptidase ue (S33 family) [Paragonimus heterotremus]|uniref:Family S33 non-peptidase ue (S33 family) n=1 Tax=Paragonimus heterotremus TaxID=100268 RepID=A0A8J4TMB8_9TREM|nr:Family S33 non-peptidase ue (S33 family) [Paragonimus heterotremus]
MTTTEVVDTKECGKITVHIQVSCLLTIVINHNLFSKGPRNLKDVILTVHDLGCNHNEMINFVSQECMEQLLNRCTWVHVLIPGQDDGEQTLPADYNFPTMQQLGEAMGEICDALGLQHVVVFGEGAGANILARMAMAREDLVLGAVLIHCTGTTAGFAENLRDRLIGWKLNNVGMNPAAESYLLVHRFGSFSESCNEVELTHILTNYRKSLRDLINPRNLNKYIMSFMARTKIIEKVDQLKCPILLITGALASHNHTVHRFYNALLQSARSQPERIKNIELVEMDEVANVLRGRPEKVAECLQFFIQGLGLASGVVSRRMSTTLPTPFRARSMSMEEYDQPKGVSTCIYDKHRKYSTAFAEGDEEGSQIPA